MSAAAHDTRAQIGEAARLKITEIFYSIQGEALFTGWPSVFVRLTGCPLRCRYCDTAYAFSGGDWRSIASIVDEVAQLGTPHVCVTGGEPLAQPRCLELLEALCERGFTVCLETSGALDIAPVDPRVHRIVDVKTPGSGEQARNLDDNIAALTGRDALKFVICSRGDYEWTRDWLAAHPELPCPVFVSPSHEELAARELADWVLADRLNVRLQVQLHKQLWGDMPGR